MSNYDDIDGDFLDEHYTAAIFAWALILGVYIGIGVFVGWTIWG